MLPDIKKPSGIRKTVQVSFGGIDLRPEAADGTFSKTLNMTSDKYPLPANRAKRQAVFSEEQVVACDLYAMDDGIFANMDGFFYYNGVAVGAASAQGGGELIPFGNKIIIPWTREIVDLTYRPKGYVDAVASLPASPSAGDAYVVNQADPAISYHMYVYESGAWTDKGPIIQSLETSVTAANSAAWFRCGTYQGEEAAWNELWIPNASKFAAGDAVTIAGCRGQAYNNQTLIVREVTADCLRFYENSFKPAMLGVYKFADGSGGPAFDTVTLYEVRGDGLPDNGEKRYFMVPSAIISAASWEPEVPDVVVLSNAFFYRNDADDKPFVYFYKWNTVTEQYEQYGYIEVKAKSAWSEYEYEGGVEFEATDTNPAPNTYGSGGLKDYYEPTITVSKKWPEGIWGVFADSNRLWGWVGHQIRCSKLGDPSNWNFFDGVAEDAWAVDVLDPDKFTGGISANGYPTFFTEHKRYRIYGSEPEAFQLGEQECNGVRDGCGKSMVAFDGALYYVSRVGIMQDTGAAPVCVSEALGLLRLKEAVGGGHMKRYYVTGKDDAGTRHNLILDTGNGVWIDEGSRYIQSYAAASGILHEAEFTGWYEDELTIWARGAGSPMGAGTAEGTISSELVTNDYTMAQPNRKRVHRVQLRFIIGSGASLAVAIQYDGDGTWHAIKTISGDGKKKSVYLPVIPRRCDHFRLKFAGSGDWELHSLALDLRQGSAVF